MVVFGEQGRFAQFSWLSRRTQNRGPVIPPEMLCPVPPDLVISRPARYPTGQGRLPLTPATAIDVSSPPPD
ncbi:MAG TPA: hypothetical protein VFB58_03795 [Chloroflexota bacterium]|nr:hypothetical protein [Chloroflexota bacterium]